MEEIYDPFAKLITYDDPEPEEVQCPTKKKTIREELEERYAELDKIMALHTIGQKRQIDDQLSKSDDAFVSWKGSLIKKTADKNHIPVNVSEVLFDYAWKKSENNNSTVYSRKELTEKYIAEWSELTVVITKAAKGE